MNSTDNRKYIMPFVMVKGSDSKEQLKEKFGALKARGIYSAVLQYAGSGDNGNGVPIDADIFNRIIHFDDIYFDMLDRLSDVCDELAMTFWVQDAAPFPTGNANGLFVDKYPDKAKKCIIEHHVDFRGPKSEAVILSDNFKYLCNGDVEKKLRSVFEIVTRKRPVNKLLGASLVRRICDENGISYDIDNAVDLTENISEGVIRFDVIEGEWRLFLFFETRSCGREHYMNLIDRESVKVQIEGVHELHYARLKEKLSRTWAGFFYDEPEIGNTGGYIFDCLPGYRASGDSIPLPWSDELAENLKRLDNGDLIRNLPALWYPCGENTRIIRYLYMDIVTKLVEENYNGQVYEWCRERDIPYIGHALEDENSHCRLGCGPGHFFRMQKYQDMAGIDIVGGQIMPGCDFKGYSWYGCSDGDGEFYHYGLAKLASSEAHISPVKKGRSICEFNAVYSGISDAKLQKFLADHLFVRGVNNLIPVATEELPEEHGKLLFNYCRRMCRMLNGSKPVMPVALLYHAESEWAGDFQYFHIPGKELMTAQIDFDVIPCDALAQHSFYGTEIRDSRLVINDNTYKALVLPYCKYIRKDTAEFIRAAVTKGLPVYFIDEFPEAYCEITQKAIWDDDRINIVPLSKLANRLRKDGIFDISMSPHQKNLRYSHFIKDGQDHYMFMNEDPKKHIETEIVIPFGCSLKRYDAIDGSMNGMDFERTENQTKFRLKLGHLGSMVVVCEETGEPNKQKEIPVLEIKDFTVSNGSDETIYSAYFDLPEKPVSDLSLDLGNVCGSAEVFLNDVKTGLRIATPYVFDISAKLLKKENHLVIKVSGLRGSEDAFTILRKPFGILSASTYSVHNSEGMTGTAVFRRNI